MILYDNAYIDQMVIHHVGNKANEEPCFLSQKPLQLDTDNPVPELLKNYFVSAFKPDIQYAFSAGEGQPIENNYVFQRIVALLEDPSRFMEISHELTRYLYESSNHPNIKSGEFYVVLFNDIQIGDDKFPCVGLFKSENKETFIKVFTSDGGLELQPEQGMSIKKLDKGCLVYGVDKENGYVVSVVDNLSKQGEALFWKEHFLGLESRKDNYFMTHNYMNLCKGFVADVFNKENEVQRTEQIDFLNRSLDFFKDNDAFQEERFLQDVIGDDDIAQAFNEYKETYQNDKQIPLAQEFDISNDAVNKQKRHFKSIIKLDKNFHVYVHGNRNLIEKGFDAEKGMQYYRLYFDSEI